MALDLFKLLGTIEIDNDKANEALRETSTEGEESESKLGRAFSKIGKGAVAVGKTVATGLAVGATAFAGLAAKALGAGGELEQNMGGSEAVFGEYAAKMQDTAKTAFSNMGLSTSDYLATANKMGALFQGAGFDIEESMNLSSDAMQRAADVASIMGIDTGAAMEAIAGAAKGNFTMMDNLGVAMNDTAIEAYALSKGIEKSTADMTQQEKIGLAMEMFMEKTAYATGNYAKENETLAGSLGTAKAALTNFLDGSGSVDDLVSSFGNLANVAVSSLQEILPRLVTGVTDIINQITPMLPPLLQKLLPSIIQGATSLVNGLVTAFPSIITAILDVLPSLIQGVEDIINALVAALPQIIETIVSALPTLIPLLINSLVNIIVTICENFMSIIQPIIDYLPDIIISIVEAVVNNLPALIQGIITLVMGIVEAIPEIIQSLVDAIPIIVEMIVTSLLSNLPTIIAGIAQIVWGIVKAIPKLFGSIIDSVVKTFEGLWKALKNVFSPIGNWINKNVVQPIVKFFTNLWSKAKEIWNNITTSISKAVNAVKTVVTNIWNSIKSATTAAWNAVKNAISKPVNAVKSTVSNIFDNIKTKISNVVNSIRTTVSDVFNRVKSAMETPIQKARDTIKGIVDKIKGFFSGMKLNFPNIKLPHFSLSPSGWKIGDLLKGDIPKLSIDWYAKAMNDPMIMTSPTIFGYDASTGQLMGGGEVPGGGGEVVSGVNTLMGMMRTVVATQNEAVVKVLTAILNAIVGGNQETLRALLADKTFKVGEREFARLVREYA